MKKNILYILLLITSSVVQAQDYKADYKKALSIFGASSYEMKMEYLLYPTYNSLQEIEREYIHIKREDEQYNVDQFGVKAIQNNQHLLVIAEDYNLIAIDRKREKADDKKLDAQTLQNLDNALEKLTKKLGLDTLNLQNNEPTYEVKHSTNDAKDRVYTFIFSEGQYEKMIVHFSDDAKLKKQIIYYQELVEIDINKFSKVRVEINFLKQVLNPNFKDNTFSISQYISVQDNGTVKALGKYSNFNLINHLEEIKY